MNIQQVSSSSGIARVLGLKELKLWPCHHRWWWHTHSIYLYISQWRQCPVKRL